jgi:hypothetical protein
MAKKYTPDSHMSFRLEEALKFPWRVVGTPEWIKESIPANFPASNLITVHGRSEIEIVRKPLLETRVLGVDTESSGPREMDGLDAVSPSSRIVCGQIGTRNETFVIEPRLIPEFGDILQDKNRLKLLQNAVHDFRFLMAKYGIHMCGVYCTMLAEQVLTAGMEGVGVGLADLVRKYRPHRIISKAVRNEFIRFDGRFTQQMLYYAARDIPLLFPLYDEQRVLLARDNLNRTAKREFDIIPVMAEMTLTGVYCDATYLRQTIAYYVKMQDKTIARIFEIYNNELDKRGLIPMTLLGPDPVTWNLKSHQETKARLKVINIHVEKTDYDTMIQLDHPIGKPLADLSGYTKVLDNYGESMLERIHYHSGRIHTNVDQLGSGEHAQRGGKDKKATIATGRMSGDLMQLPRPEKIMAVLEKWEQDKVRAAFMDRILELQQEKKAA